MDKSFEKALEMILNTDLDEFQEKLNRVKRINIQKTIEQLKANGKTNSPFYKSLLELKDLDFEKYQNSLDAVKKLDLGLSKKVSQVHNQMDVSDISSKRTIFISYSHQDSKYLDRLKVHLKPLEKQSLIELWDDTMIQSGDKWREKISTAIDNSTVAILLISSDFLASEFITENELPPLLEKAEAKDTLILPVILNKCRFEREKSLSVFQAFNSPEKPVSLMSAHEQDVLWDSVSIRIEELL